MGDINDENGKMHLYRKLKNNFCFEPYLNQIKKNKVRRSMTAIRISAHRLEIETGRYIGKKREERLCSLCKENDIKAIGSEIHAILHCPSFKKERDGVLNFITKRYPNFKSLDDQNRIIFMLTCENECLQFVSKFIHVVLSFNRPKK